MNTIVYLLYHDYHTINANPMVGVFVSPKQAMDYVLDRADSEWTLEKWDATNNEQLQTYILVGGAWE